VIKNVSLGESKLIASITAVLGLTAFASVVFLTWRVFHPLLSWVLGYCATVPFVMLRRRFGQLQLVAADGALRFYPHGPLLKPRTIPIETVRSVSEFRLSNLEPMWALVIEFVDGSRAQLGTVRSPNIHEFVAELNAFVRVSRGGGP
jgi:hypothetical protein